MSDEFFIWGNSYSVGDPTIDNQHKILVDILNNLYQAYIEKRHSEEIYGVLTELSDYTHYHFRMEENLMQMGNYPQLQEHKNEHDFFTNELKCLKEKYMQLPSILSLKVMTFLQKWLREHILGSDQKYRGYIVN